MEKIFDLFTLEGETHLVLNLDYPMIQLLLKIFVAYSLIVIIARIIEMIMTIVTLRTDLIASKDAKILELQKSVMSMTEESYKRRMERFKEKEEMADIIKENTTCREQIDKLMKKIDKNNKNNKNNKNKHKNK